MGDYIALAIVAIIIIAVISYIIKRKKKGAKCIGCPYADCPSKRNGNCCNSENKY